MVDLRPWQDLKDPGMAWERSMGTSFFSTLTMLQAWLFLTLCYFLQI